jgi:hypothetical protein
VKYIRFRGVDRRGTSQGGCLPQVPAELAKQLFNKGYRSATITDLHGREVGAVCRRADKPHRRTWWGEE